MPPPSPQPTPLPSPPDGGDGESDDDDDDDDDDADAEDEDNRNLTPTQRFLLHQSQRTAVVVGTNNAAMSVLLQDKKVRFSENLSKVLPEASDTIESEHQPKILEKGEITVSNVQSVIKELNEGKLPDQLKFFSG